MHLIHFLLLNTIEWNEEIPHMTQTIDPSSVITKSRVENLTIVYQSIDLALFFRFSYKPHLQAGIVSIDLWAFPILSTFYWSIRINQLLITDLLSTNYRFFFLLITLIFLSYWFQFINSLFVFLWLHSFYRLSFQFIS
jgi:hypothetical protein